MESCQFLENLTFSSLIAPVTEEEFRTRYWEQKPLIVRRGDPNYYGNLFTLEDFDKAITCSPSYVKINDATNKSKGTTIQFSTAKGLEAMLADLRAGGTIILEKLHRQEPKLGLFCRLLGHELGHIFEANLYLTPPSGRSSVPHWDNTDVFILQVVGSKHWRIEQVRRIFPIRPYRMGDDVREFRGECTSLTLTQGDLLYIPRGFMHVAECGSEASLHISLGLVPVVLEELLHAIIKAAVQHDERLRIALPLGFMHGRGSDVVNGAIAALRNAADEIFVQAVFNQFRDELIQEHPLDVSGQVAGFFEPSPLTTEDIVGPRRGVVYRIHIGNDSVRLNIGSRSIAFPDFFREALDFALNTQAFTISAIPGELEDQERIVFVERLIEEGLIVRKNRKK